MVQHPNSNKKNMLLFRSRNKMWPLCENWRHAYVYAIAFSLSMSKQ